ncbi:MAG: hypothetical protein H6825_14525 [Planctomycetes bacterium]|nr:hypothetical protein [Planctomycetota bacterium]
MMVIVVLVAMAIVATPFALSMRNLESGALLERRQEEARAGAGVALAAARRHLEDTHPYFDQATPLRDTRAELFPEDLPERYPDLLPRDPKGSIRSVRGSDESGKAHLGTASIFLLGNLLGGRTRLTAAVDADATRLTVGDTEGFTPTGLLLVDGELVEYSARGEAEFDELERAFRSANLERSEAVAHDVGADVFDARLVLLVQRGWKASPGSYEPYRRVDGLMDLGLFGEATYTAGDLSRVRELLTVHGDPPRWTSERRVDDLVLNGEGGVDLVLSDASGYGPGTVVRIVDEHGVASYDLVLETVDWGDGWHVSLLEPPPTGVGTASVSTLRRQPVNVNTADPRLLVALVAGLSSQPVRDVVNDVEAAYLAVDMTDLGLEPRADDFVARLADGVEQGLYSGDDVRAAQRVLVDAGLRAGELSVVELAAFLAGTRTPGSSHHVGRVAAAEVASRIAVGKPGSHEDLRGLLDAAVADGALTDTDADLVLRNAIDPGDPQLRGGTAPFTYDSAGVFALEAADVENLPNGRESARAHVREIVSVAPPGESAHLYETQAAFEHALAPGDAGGWTSGPSLLASGPSAGRAPAPAELDDGRPRGEGDPAPIAMGDVLAAGAVALTRAATLLGGRMGPSTDGGRSWLSPAPVRSGLPGALHFDEGVAGALGSTPDGYDFAQGPLRLSLDDVQPPLLTRTTRLLQPFSVEFWTTFDDPSAETVLFDMGADELEDRISLVLREGVLVFRVADTSLADFDTGMPEGRDPPAGEIRYAFDDGLELRAGVPYHVALFAGGARDTQMALFVDGLPRGQRALTTRLSADLGPAGAMDEGASNPRRKIEIPVESTAGFPVRGAIRVGGEIMEYVEKTDDAFVVRAAGPDDPFGGRARRTTVGRDHEASELVELVGYSRPLASEIMARGDADLAGQLGPFAVAEIDPTTLTTEIYVDIVNVGGATSTPTTLLLGTGIDSKASSIPVRGLGGGALASGTFQQDGGYAILYCDYGSVFTGSVSQPGQTGSATLDAFSSAGDFIGGAEFVHYTSFDGSTLNGCARNSLGLPIAVIAGTNSLKGSEGQFFVDGGRPSTWADPRAFITTFDSGFKGSATNGAIPDTARVVVVPVSVTVDGNASEFHPSPTGVLASPPGAGWLVQVGLDFDGSDLTEFVRWDTATTNALVRDDAQAMTDMTDVLGNAAGGQLWNGDQAVSDDLSSDVDAALDFRGQGGTVDGTHETGTRVLPVHVFGRWGSHGHEPVMGLPGRHDVITLVAPDGTREQQIVNYAVSGDLLWGPDFSLVAYRDAVRNEFGWTDERDERNYVDVDRDLDLALQPGGQGARLMEERQLQRRSDLLDLIRRYNTDPRLVTRMLKAPTGELPTAGIARVRFGETYDGRPSRGRATIDELRFQRSDTFGPLLPADRRLLLSDALEFDEDDALTLDTERLYSPLAFVADSVLGKDGFEILGELPQTGGLLLVGEEIVAYTGMDPVETGAVFLAGRALYGSKRARHEKGEPVLPLSFWPASPLADSIGPDDDLLPVADPHAFPAGGGLLWVDEELLAYDRVDDDGLHMPIRPGRGGGGVFRGRFGTEPAQHRAGALVRWQPMRFADDALFGERVPEASFLTLPVVAPGAFFEDVTLRVEGGDPLAPLVGRLVLDRRASPHDDPLTTPGLYALAESETAPGLVTTPIDAQGDLLEIALGVRWLPGAFDPVRGASNAWKIVPRVKAVAVRHVQPTRVLEHEEWR